MKNEYKQEMDRLFAERDAKTQREPSGRGTTATRRTIQTGFSGLCTISYQADSRVDRQYLGTKGVRAGVSVNDGTVTMMAFVSRHVSRVSGR